jgi:chorismate dehydratase
MWDFEHGSEGKHFEIRYTVPSQCATELAKGTADIGIIPAAAYATIPNLVILPGVAIASKQAVGSILLVSHKRLDQIESVALDSSSLTSVALTRLLFEKCWGGEREFISATPRLDSMLADYDAALLIGDPALKIDRGRYHTWDLAEEWIRFTGKPFVFAFWAVRQEALKSSSLDLVSIFQQSRNRGLEPMSLDLIARIWAPRLEITENAIHKYLTTNIYYYMDAPCLEGLQLFYLYALECGALPPAPELCFVENKPALI